MAQPEDHIDEILGELRHDLSNTLTTVGIVLRLRDNQAQLLRLSVSMLRELAEHILQSLPSLPPEEGDSNV